MGRIRNQYERDRLRGVDAHRGCSPVVNSKESSQ